MSENNNVCLEYGGTGQEHSGTSYMGIDEVVSCGDCCGTGFEWPSLEIERLAAQLAQRDAELAALREKVTIEPAINMVLTIALAQLNRGEDVTPNMAAACVLKLAEIRAALSDDQETLRYCESCGALDDWCESNIESTHGACCKRCTHKHMRPDYPFYPLQPTPTTLSDDQEERDEGEER